MKNKYLQLIYARAFVLFILLFVTAGAIKSYSQITFNDGNLKYAVFENTPSKDVALVLVIGFVDKEMASKEIIIPNSIKLDGEKYTVNAIMPYAFSGCTNLVSVTLPNTITSIGEGTFFNCTGLLSVIIPNTVAFIGKNAFYGCKNLTGVSIPKTANIHENAFEGCDNLIIKWE